MDAEVIVVGAGVNGLACAWRLAERGRDVLVLERFRIGHDRGSSHGPTRIFRVVYEQPHHVRLARAALPLWRELERSPGELLLTTGGIDGGDPTTLARCAAALDEAGASWTWLDEREMRARYPWCGATGRVLFSPDTGVIDAAGTLERLRDRAVGAGARIEENVQVTHLDPERGGVAVRSQTATRRARRVVVAAGAWAPGLLATAGIGLPLRVTDEQVGYADAPDGIVPVIWRGARFFYVVPPFGGSGRAKVAEHMAGPVVDPDARASRAREHPVSDWCRDVLPSFGPWAPAERCLYATTPDQDLVFDARGDVVIVSSCSGHGFKFAPLAGEIAAALVDGATPPVPLAAYAAGRFR